MTLPDGFNALNNFDSSDQMKVNVIKEVNTMDDKLTLQLYANGVVVITIVPIGVLVMMKDDLKSCMSELFEDDIDVDTEPLSDESIARIEEAYADIGNGNFHSLEEIKFECGLDD